MNTWKINKTDQSYRFLDKWNCYIPRTFCAYYRKVMTVFCVLTMLGYCIASIPLIVVVVCVGFDPMNMEHFSWAGLGLLLSAYASIFATAGLLTTLLLWTKDKYDDWAYARREARSEIKGHRVVKEKRPSIIMTYYKAYKEKFCPLIEIVGENEED